MSLVVNILDGLGKIRRRPEPDRLDLDTVLRNQSLDGTGHSLWLLRPALLTRPVDLEVKDMILVIGEQPPRKIVLHSLPFNTPRDYQDTNALFGAYRRWKPDTVVHDIDAMDIAVGGALDMALQKAPSTPGVREKFQSFIDGYHGMLDEQTMKFAMEDGPKNLFSGSSVQAYNHIIIAQTPQSQEFRRNAVTLLAPLGTAFQDGGMLWDAIDKSDAPQAALGKTLGVRPSTVADILARPHVLRPVSFAKSDITREVRFGSYFLEALPISHWPENINEATYFHHMARYVDRYIGYGRAPVTDEKMYRVMRDVGRQIDLKAPDRWERLFREKLSRQEKAVLTEVEEDERQAGPKVVIHGRDREVVSRLESDFSGVWDMKGDVLNRIVTPLVILEFERQNMNVLKLDGIRYDLLHKVGENFWKSSPPSEQFSISSYWHSERVHFQHRVESAGVIAPDMGWKNFIVEPYVLDIKRRKAVFESLDSDAKLKEHKKHMGVCCVDSMGIACLRDGLHIFAIRDISGKRLATFGCKESGDVINGRPQLQLHENKAPDNATPPAWVQEAGDEFIRRANVGELPLDWEASRKSKEAFSKQEIDKTVGYDFRNPEQLSRVYAVYRPLVPKKVPGDARTNVEALAKYLEISQAVEKFISEHNEGYMTYLGIVPVSVPRQPAEMAARDLPLAAPGV